MSTTTKNLGFLKPELTDAADITAYNENWDKIDSELEQRLSKSETVKDVSIDVSEDKTASIRITKGDDTESTSVAIATSDMVHTFKGEMKKYVDDETVELTPLTRISTGLSTNVKDYALTLEPGFYAVHFTGTSYTGTDLPNGNYKYGSAIIYVRLKADVITIMLFGSETYPPQFAYCNGGVWGEWSTQFLPLSGGLLKGNLDFKKVENGSATIYKNHGTSSDYGLIIRDVMADGKYNQLNLCAAENALKYRDTSGEISQIPKIQTGTYTGTGKSGSSNPNTITFNFEPKVVFITTENQGSMALWLKDNKQMMVLNLNNTEWTCGGTPNSVTLDGKTFSWYGANVYHQLNASGNVHNYVAFG